MTRTDLIARLEAAGVPVAPINTIEDAFNDAQVIARGLKLDLAQAGTGHRIPGVRTPILLSETPLRYPAAAPALGADTRAVLAALKEETPP